MKTLSQLKEENAKAEAEEREAQPDTEAESATLPDDDTEAVDGQSADQDTDDGDDQSQEVFEDFLNTGEDENGDDDDSNEKPQVPVAKHVEVKQKLKGRIREKDSEIEELRRQIEELRTGSKTADEGPQSQASQPASKLPRLSDFEDAEDPEAAYSEAMLRHTLSVVQSTGQQQQQQQKQQEAEQRREAALEDHYTRVATIVTIGHIDVDKAREAEASLRQSVDSVMTGQGDLVVDAMIERLGEGSEKVVLHLGRNPNSRARFIDALKEDPTGLKAAMVAAELKSKFSSSANKRVTNAPKPSSRKVAGGGDGTTQQERAFKKRLSEARKKPGAEAIQAAIAIKQEAKAAGLNTEGW
jgi:hypothetical protein